MPLGCNKKKGKGYDDMIGCAVVVSVNTTKQNIRTILNATCSAIAESSLPLKYQIDAVQTVVYVQNFIPLV